MSLLYRFSIKEKIFLATLAVCLVLWLSFGIAVILAFQSTLSLKILLLMAAAFCVFLVLARKFAGYITKPILSLTELADKISEGNIDVELDFGKKVKCWEIKNCSETQCPAYGKDDVLCWFVDETPCRDCVPRFPDKLVQCRNCFVYKDHRGDEIIQLADSFRHMVFKLKESHHELEMSHRLQDGVISHSFDGILGGDMEGNVLIFNRAASSVTQYSKTEVVGKMKIQEFFPLEFGLDLQKRLRDELDQSIYFLDHETQLKTKQEHFIPVKVTICVLKREHEPFGMVCFIKDLREVERLKEELLKSERRALVGEITAALSHYIRNIIDGMRGGSYVLKKGQQKERWDLVKKGWEMIDQNLRRIDEVAYQFLNVSESQTLHVITYDINRLLEETVSLVRDRVERASIHLETMLGGSPLIAEVDPDAVRHCFFNLLLNAIDACDAVDEGQGKIQIHAEDGGDGWISVSISDNGLGMPESTKDKLFKEPFVTNKSSKLGLGLFVVSRLIRGHGGEVKVESQRGYGTRISVMLSQRFLGKGDVYSNLELSG